MVALLPLALMRNVSNYSCSFLQQLAKPNILSGSVVSVHYYLLHICCPSVGPLSSQIQLLLIKLEKLCYLLFCYFRCLLLLGQLVLF